MSDLNNETQFPNEPNKIPCPWGYANPVTMSSLPDGVSASAGYGRADWMQGFPPDTAKPIKSGGVPPHYNDFQMALNDITKHEYWNQIGGRYSYDSAFDYPAGAVVTHGGKVYQCLQANGPHVGASGSGIHAPGAAIPAGSAPYWGVLAPIDGETIAVNTSAGSAKGLAQVNPDYVARNVADGATIVSAGGKLHVGPAIAGSYVTATGAGSTLKLNVDKSLLATSLAGLNMTAGTDGKLSCIVSANGVTTAYVQQQASASAAAARTAAVTTAGNYSANLNAKLGSYVKKAGDTVTGNLNVNGAVVVGGAETVNGVLTAKGNAAVSGTFTVAKAAAFSGNLTVKGVFSATAAVGYAKTPAAGAKGNEIVNAAWVSARMNELRNSFNSLAKYTSAPVTVIKGTFNGAKFTSTGQYSFRGSIGQTSSGNGALVEGRYIVRNCIPYKPVIVMHDCLKAGDAWHRIRAGYFSGQTYNVGASNIGGITCPALTVTGNNCRGGVARPGQWYELGIANGMDEECFIVMPTNSFCVIDVWDDPRGDGGGWSDDDRIWFFN